MKRVVVCWTCSQWNSLGAHKLVQIHQYQIMNIIFIKKHNYEYYLEVLQGCRKCVGSFWVIKKIKSICNELFLFPSMWFGLYNLLIFSSDVF